MRLYASRHIAVWFTRKVLQQAYTRMLISICFTVWSESSVTGIHPYAQMLVCAHMAAATQNTNNTTIRSEGKLVHLEQPMTPLPYPVASQAARDAYEALNDAQNEVTCLMLGSMSPELQRTLENYKAYDMIQELKTMFKEQAKQELFEIVKAFHACKQEDGQSVSSYLLKMKSYLDTLKRLGYAIQKELGVSLILNSLNKDYDQFVHNYNMHSMGKTIAELHVMLKLHKKDIPKKAKTPAVLAIRGGKIQKDKKKPQGAKGKAKGKNKLAPMTKIPPPPKRDNLAKDSICNHCKEVGHWRRNCPSYHAELKKRKNASEASTSGIFTIVLHDFSNNTWVYDTGCGTHICNTSQGLRRSKKLKHGALSLYMGNGMRAAIEAIRSFDLILPSGLIIVLDECHFAPTVTRGVVLISRLVKNDYIHIFTNYGVSVSKYNVFYFNAILRDGIYEIDMHNLYLNISSNYNVSNKRAKHGLDSYYLWHCHLGRINKKRMDMLQRDGLLQPTHDETHEKCKTMSREGANYLITFTDDFSRYGFDYLMKHKHKVFETFKVFHNEVENQLGKKIKAIRSDRGGEYLSHEFVNHMKSYGIVSQLTLPYTTQHNGVSERRNRTLLDMVRFMMNLTTLPKSFWGYALETAARILNMVPRRLIKCIFLGYPKEAMGYYFYYPLKNKIFVSRNAEFFENSFMVQEASGSHGLLEMSESDKGLGIIQEEYTQPFENTSKEHNEIAPIEVKPQNVRVPIRRSVRIPQAQDIYGHYVDVKEYELGDLDEPPNYKVALADPESNKWLEAMNTEM
ncbi:zinc finger, CCHC-type containing protein [Tanacetum coccineum]